MILFYGHKEGEDHACFSNWYPSVFEVNGYTYSTSEQYMMHQKALLFGDIITAEKIMRSTTPAEAKTLGRKVKPFNKAIWDGLKQLIVYQGLLEKFSQNIDMRNELLATGDEILVEASPRDSIWGIRMGKNNPDALNIENWKGKNLLGFTLMAVRNALRNPEGTDIT